MRRRLSSVLVLFFLLIGLATATAGTASAAGCEESTWRDYTLSSQAWSSINGQRFFAPRTSGTYAVTSTKTTTRTVSLTGEVGVSGGVAVVELNAKIGGSYTRSVSISNAETTTVNVPSLPYEQVVNFGIWQVRYYVTEHRLTPSCARVTAGSGYLTVYRERVARQRA